MKQKPKLIIGLVGEIASGKDTMANYLAKKYHSQTVSFSQPLRDILDRLYLPQTRSNMANLGIALRRQFGQDLLSRVIAQEVAASRRQIVCLPNVRLESDIVHLKNLKNFVLVAIEADAKIRYRRITARRQNPDDRGKTWAQFVKDSQLPTETKIRQLAKKSKFKINNNGNYQQLYRQVDELMGKVTRNR